MEFARFSDVKIPLPFNKIIPVGVNYYFLTSENVPIRNNVLTNDNNFDADSLGYEGSNPIQDG